MVMFRSYNRDNRANGMWMRSMKRKRSSPKGMWMRSMKRKRGEDKIPRFFMGMVPYKVGLPEKRLSKVFVPKFQNLGQNLGR